VASESPARIPVRHHPAHCPVVEVSNRSIIVFLTVCVRGRRRLLARPEIRDLLLTTWREAAEWLVGRFVLMPDHLHLFCTPAERESMALGSWVKFWKSRASKAWPFADERPVWQADFWDRQLRWGESYGQKWDYVMNNPVRAGLCASPEDWLFQGEVAEFRFHND
jgi:putative transposase